MALTQGKLLNWLSSTICWANKYFWNFFKFFQIFSIFFKFFKFFQIFSNVFNIFQFFSIFFKFFNFFQFFSKLDELSQFNKWPWLSSTIWPFWSVQQLALTQGQNLKKTEKIWKNLNFWANCWTERHAACPLRLPPHCSPPLPPPNSCVHCAHLKFDLAIVI